MKILINNEEVLSNKNFTIKEEMLNTSSVILNNVYPKSWEQTKDYTSQFYYPKDYSKCKIIEEEIQPAEEGIYVEGTNLTLTDVDTTKLNELTELDGNTTQSGTPTPSSPQPINVVSGRQEVDIVGKNLLNYNATGTGQGINYAFSGSELSLNQTTTSGGQIATTNTQPITLQAGTYTFSSTTSGTFTANGKSTAIYLKKLSDNTGIITLAQNNNYTLTSTFTLTETTKVYVQIYTNGAGFVFDNFNIKWQIEKGSTATEYEEYKGQSYEINLGKNLFNINDFFSKHQSITIENNSIILGNVVYQPIVYVLRIENNKNYTISFNSSTTNVYRLQVKDSDSSGTSGTTLLNKSITSLSYSGNFTTTSEYIRIEFFQSTSTETQIISNIQLEKGSQATPYSPYKTPIELCKIGTYQDRIYKDNGTWYLHKEIGKVVLDGSESNWVKSSNTTFDRFILGTHIGGIVAQGGYSNYFKVVNVNVASNLYEMSNNGNSQLVFNYSTYGNTTLEQFKTWLSTHNTIVYYVLATPTTTEITDTELISQLNAIELLEGLNNISITSAYLPGTIRLHYNYTNEQIIETLLFCGIVKNTGNISLNPREPHYCSLQILDFKNFLSQGETLDFVIANKTILEAIEQIISTISGYGFVLGNVDILGSYDMIGAYSTKDKTAYDVFNYIADITQSRWTTRMINENQVAIDFYDPTLMPEGTAIEYTKEWFETNNINDMSFSYSSNDYRNKQVMTSSEVYGNMEQQETKTADGYNTQFFTEQRIGKINQIVQNNVQKTFATDDEKAVGVIADFYYTPGENYFESADNVSIGDTIIIQYIPIVEGRQIITNSTEIDRINSLTGRKGIIARYETRNDATTSQELQKIGQSYIKYKGIPEIKLKIETLNNIWNIGDRVQFNAPLEELTTEYMVKSKEINYITTIDNVFYKYTLTSSFNSESDINYFDNQRSKANGNIGAGEYVSRNVDIESVGNIIFYDYRAEEIEITGDNTLNSVLNAPFIN